MTAESTRSASRFTQDLSREFARSVLGSSAIALRHGPHAFLRTREQSRAASAAFSQVKGGAIASAALVIGTVSLRSLREKQRSLKSTAREIASEGMAEAICGGASALDAAASGLAAGKLVIAAGIGGAKGTLLLVGVPLTSAVITTVIARHLYDHAVGAHLNPPGPIDECCA
jgi:hypothetical protein